jgi:predicted PurR-regulated permease PerM
LLSLAAAAGLFGAGLFLTAEVQTFRADWPRYEDGLVKLVGKQTGEAGKPLRELIQLSSRDVYHFLFEAGVGVTEVLIMTFFYLLFLILGADKLAARVRRALPPDRAEQAVSVGQQIETGMEQFMKVKTLVSAGMGAVTALLCYVFGLDHWLLWGFLFFVGNYITYIGSIAACGPPIVLAYLDLESPVAATVLAVLIVVNRIAWIDYVEIKMSGKSLNIDSILLFLWLAYWGWAWGVLGLILAFPMITSLKIVLEHLEGTRSWAVLMSED